MTDRAAATPDDCAAPYRVRFDECGPDGLLRTSSVLRYAQDLAWFHSAKRGFTRAWYAERGLVWLARAAEVTITGPVRVGDELVGTTRVVGWRRVWARRWTDFADAHGQTVAWTHVDWVLLGARGKPTRIPQAFDGAFGAPDAPFPLGRVDPGPTPADADPATFTVRPQELDPMDHANNAVYADWVDERVIAVGGTEGIATSRRLPRRERLEYARPAGPSMIVTALTWPADDGGWWCRLQDEAANDLLRAYLGPG